MNKDILYNKNLDLQERFLYVLMESFQWEIDVDRIAEIMGVRKNSVFKLLDRLGEKNLIDTVIWKKNTCYLNIKPTENAYQDFPELNVKEIFANSRKPIPPSSIEEVKEYFYQQKKSPEEAISFYNYYDAVGWHSGNQPITNWRSKALSWSGNKFNKQAPIQPEHNETDEQLQRKKGDFWNREWK